jgi:hypothetical protein
MRRSVFSAATSFAFACATVGVLSAQTTSPTRSARTPLTYTGCLQPGSALASGRTLTPGASTTNTPPLSGYILTNARPSGSAASESRDSGATEVRDPTAASPATMPPPGQSPTTTTPPATPPTTPPAEAMGRSATNAGAMYHLVGLQDDELQKFTNQQVEVRGMLESTDTTATSGTTGAAGQPRTSQPATPAPNSATGTSGTTEAVGTSSGSTPSAGQPVASSVPTFRATSIRVVSATCSGGTL